MNKLANEPSTCDKLQERLKRLCPEMTFRVFPQSPAAGGFKIYGQRTKNMRYDRPNRYAAFDLSSDAYNAADQDGAETLLRSAVADLEVQLRRRDE
jgi:hypothetical protein